MPHSQSRYTSLLLVAALLFACRKEQAAPVPEPLLIVPRGFPEPPFPADNALTEARWTLGKKLFFDPIMSRDSSLSCASCHLPSHAFSDTLPLSPGIEARPGTRNAPTLANVAYLPYYTREGGLPSLEMQVLVPIQEHNEFDFNIIPITERMKRNAEYVQLSQEAYGREPQAFVITRALSTFERTLVSGESPYDLFHFHGKKEALNAAELRGMDLFFSDKTHCSACHGGFNFTTSALENNGLYEQYADPGRFRLTGLESDRARFKTPTLRNIARTAPYMHDGSFPTLESVIEHYNSGGKEHPNKSPLIKPLNLTSQEKTDLAAFLKSLTDQKFLNDPRFRP